MTRANGKQVRRIHHAAPREVRSGNAAPFASRNFLVSLWLRIFLRTSREAGLLRLGAAAIFLAAAWISVAECGYVTFAVVAVGALLVLATTWRAVVPRKAWEDPMLSGVNRLPTHSRMGNYPTFQAAEARGQSPNVVSLSGVWKFFLASGVANAPAGFEHPEFSDDSWSNIRVPGHWQLQSAGKEDPPIYTNTHYPFPNHPPYAPKANPTGLYRRTFALPREWFVRVAERPSVARLKGRVVLIFQGVDSAFHLWINGVMVGFAKGSRLPCEFDVTGLLREQQIQSLCLRVVRWSDGSYLEDQDHWWLSGVYREVELALRPTPTRISDFIARPMLCEDDSGSYSRGSLEVEVLIERDTIPTSAVSQVSSAPTLYPQQQSRGLPQLTAAGLATVTDSVYGKGDDSNKRDETRFAYEGMEAGGVVGEGWRQDERLESRRTEMVICTLVDTKTGQRFLLDAAGSAPNWQMGLPPGYARRAQRRQRRSCCEAANKIASGVCFDCRRDDDASVHGAARGAGIKRHEMMPATSVRLFRLDRLPGEVRIWSAEDPQLYTLVVELRVRTAREEQEGDAGTVTFSQFESARVGFRSVLVHSGQLLVNGRAVMLAGVNRHEHDPDTGKTVSEASMRRDIITMKRFNFNAVRNCHYPNHWRWYELCDEMGLYVCDEANIESHGQIPLCRLSADPAWRLAYLDRVWRMVAANKNHSCIILWSLGNESGDGSNLVACRRLIKVIDPSRPVAYEGGGRSLAEGCGCTNLTDIVFPMYTSVEATALLGTDGPEGVGETRPCVLCEYSHSMGNSNGNLHKYWEIFRKHRRLQGGFMWDWVDQGLTKHDPVSGRQFWADGGGFSGRYSEGYDVFCLNGVTFPDRSPHPALWEAKYLAQPVGLELLPNSSSNATTTTTTTKTARISRSALSLSRRSDNFSPCGLSTNSGNEEGMESGRRSGGEQTAAAAGKRIAVVLGGAKSGSLSLVITNRYTFLSLDHLSAEWRLQSVAGSGVDSTRAGGFLSLENIAAGDSHEIELNLGNTRGEKETGGDRMAHAVAEMFLHVEVRLRADTAWAQAGHLVAWECLQVAVETTASAEVHVGGTLGTNGAGQAVDGAVGTPRSRSLPALIVYDDEHEESLSSQEGSPMGQLKEHLLSNEQRVSQVGGLIVVKGMLDKGEGVLGDDAPGAHCRHTFSGEWMLVVSRVDGAIQRFVTGGVDLIERGADLCLWRAATDNDRAGWPTLMNFVADHRSVAFLSRLLPLSHLSHLERWQASGLSATDPPVFQAKKVSVDRASSHECIIKVVGTCSPRRRKSSVLFHVWREIRVAANGEVEVTTSVVPVPGAVNHCVSLARVGLSLRLPPGFSHVEWYGCGPFECYQDRKHGAVIDFHSGTVEEQQVPYIHPSENGGKADVRWMALRRGQGGVGILLQAERDRPFEAASCGLFTAAELQHARRTIDLPLRTACEHPVFVHLDHRSMGVGGDNSWYPNVVHKEYTVPANSPYRFRVRMKALSSGEAAPLAALAPSLLLAS